MSTKPKANRVREENIFAQVQLFDKYGKLVFTGSDIGPSMALDSVPEAILEMSVEDYKEAFNDDSNLEVIDLGVATGEKYKPPIH